MISKLPCALVDVDGTLALRGDRDPHDLSLVIEDTPRKYMPEVLEALSEMLFIMYVSGMEEHKRKDIVTWLSTHGFMPGMDLLLRKNGDRRGYVAIKEEMLGRLSHAYDIVVVLSGDIESVRMWRQNGLLCLNPNNEKGGT